MLGWGSIRSVTLNEEVNYKWLPKLSHQAKDCPPHIKSLRISPQTNLPQIIISAHPTMSGNSSVDQRNVEQSNMNTADRFEEGKQNSHLGNDASE